MTFTILATLEVASLLVFATSLYGSVRAVYARDKLRKQTPLTLLSRYRVLYRRVAAVWVRYAVGALVLANAWWVPLYMGFGGEETTAWMSAYVSVNWAFRLLPIVMAGVAAYYYMRSRKYGNYGDESPSRWTEREEIENQDVRQISAESVNEKASKLGGTWESELAHALNRQTGEHPH
jgi:hypothetical protein